MKLKIYIFRHGQTYFNRDGRFTGNIDSDLTRKGREDAKIVAERLKNKKFQIAYHTKLDRSRDTLKIILKYHPECKKIIEDNRIIERLYGILEGKTHWSLVKKKGPAIYDKWHRSYRYGPPKGESFVDVEKRVGSFIKDLKKLMKKEKVNVAISAHGNSIRLFRKIMEKAPVKEVAEWFIPYDDYYEYNIKA